MIGEHCWWFYFVIRRKRDEHRSCISHRGNWYLVAVLDDSLTCAGTRDMATMVTIAGLVIVLFALISLVSVCLSVKRQTNLLGDIAMVRIVAIGLVGMLTLLVRPYRRIWPPLCHGDRSHCPAKRVGAGGGTDELALSEQFYVDATWLPPY